MCLSVGKAGARRRPSPALAFASTVRRQSDREQYHTLLDYIPAHSHGPVAFFSCYFEGAQVALNRCVQAIMYVCPRTPRSLSQSAKQE